MKPLLGIQSLSSSLSLFLSVSNYLHPFPPAPRLPSDENHEGYTKKAFFVLCHGYCSKKNTYGKAAQRTRTNAESADDKKQYKN